MKSILLLILLVPILIWDNVLFSQAIVWEEGFTYSDGTTQGSGIPPKWTIDVSNCTFSNANDYFEVRGNQIEGRDIDGEAVFYTEIIDISAFPSVNLSVSVESTNNMETTDYLRVYYKLDGGPVEQFFSVNGNNSGSIAPTYAQQFDLSGSSVQIICRILNDGAAERHYIDDILVYSPIPGDDCSDAIVISEVNDFPFSTTGATTSGQNPGCGGTDPMDIWFSYTPASNGFANVDLCGSLFDTRLAVWDACGGSVLFCNDDDDNCGIGSLQSYLSGPVTAGTTYYIQVGGYDSNVGDGNITISLTTAAINDNCNNAIPLSEVTDYPFSTLSATSSGQNPGCGGNQDPVDIWFTYTPALNGFATIDLCGSLFNTRLAIWNSCGGSVLLCNDDDDYCESGSTQSSLGGNVNAGTTYYIQIGGYNTVTGTGDITITLDPFPSNNDCANALAINEVTDLPFNTKQATASGAIPDCGGTIAPVDLWYAYTATSTGTALFDLCGSNFITRLALWDGCGGNVLACNEILGPECLLQSSFEYDVIMGATYYVQVGGWNANVGNGDLSIFVYPFPTNDDCADAIAINEVFDLPFSTKGATAGGDNPGCGGGQDPIDIWFEYTATVTGFASIDLCGSNFNTRLAVWDGCGGNVLACNDIFGPSCFSFQSSLEMDVVSGTTYFVQVGGNNTDYGIGDLTIIAIPYPTNDECSNAIVVGEVTDLPFTTVGATAGGDNPGCGGGQDPIDIWYSYTPAQSGIVTVDLCGSFFNTRLAVWDACGGNVLICNDNDNYCGLLSQTSYVSGPVTAGTTYFIQVGGNNASIGNGDLTIMFFPDPTNDDCANAIPINEVTDLPFTTVGATAGGDNPGCGGGQDPVDIWYAYTASTSGLAAFDLCGSNFNTRLAIWDACGGNLLACNDDFGPVCFSQQSSIKMQVTAGVTYYVQVGGNNASTGTGDLTIFLDIPGRWTGAVSNNWSTASNWLNGNVPLMGTNVLVPGNPSGGKFPETNSGSGAKCKDLVVQPGAKVYIPTNNTLTVNGNIINNAGTNGLVVKSDNTGTGSLLHSNSGVNATVEQYLTSERWHLVSPPISNAQISAYFDIYLKAYNEPTDTWTYLVEPTTIPMNATQGYSAWASDNYTGSTTVNYSGTLNTGNFTVSPLSYTPVSPNTGWNLIGNPYPSALQWNNTWIKTGVGDWACVHNNGNDECYNAATGTGWPNASDMANGVIPVSQGFWVRATAAGASLTIPQSERLHSSQPFYKNSLVKVENTIRLRVDGNSDFDVVLFQFTSKAKEGFDGNYDLEKRWGYTESPNIYSIAAENELYSVDVRPTLEGDRVMPIGLEIGANGLYTIEAAELSGFISGDNVILEDIKEGEFIELAEGTIYNFDANVEDDFHRFNLHIQKSSNQVINQTDKNIRIYSYGNIIYIKTDNEKIEQVLIYDLLGHEIFRDGKLYSEVSRIQLTTKKGYYFVKVRTGNNLYTEKVYLR